MLPSSTSSSLGLVMVPQSPVCLFLETGDGSPISCMSSFVAHQSKGKSLLAKRMVIVGCPGSHLDSHVKLSLVGVWLQGWTMKPGRGYLRVNCRLERFCH